MLKTWGFKKVTHKNQTTTKKRIILFPFFLYPSKGRPKTCRSLPGGRGSAAQLARSPEGLDELGATGGFDQRPGRGGRTVDGKTWP